MNEHHNKFLKDSEKVAFDKDHRRKINKNMSAYMAALEKGKEQYKDLELAKKKAANIKHKVISELDKYLIEFEMNFSRSGGKVIWAQNKREAVKELVDIIGRTKATSIVKSKSMISEEIDLNEVLEKKKIETVETDLGEYIVQIAGEKPYHIVTPAMHKSKEDVTELYHQKFGTPEDSTPEEITSFTREKLRKDFLRADIAITGANFLVAETGSVCITENEGNALMSISFPRIHIVIAGIEKLIPTLTDLQLFWPMLSTHGTGQKVTVYNHIISGPRQEYEIDGPQEMYVLLIDNGRSDVLKQERQRRAMSCIKCGACLNVCPVYRNIGGYTYGAVYSGPIGSVINPYLLGMRDYKHLSFASSLCGACTEVCPVKIPLHELLLLNRQKVVKEGMATRGEKIAMKGATRALTHRNLMNIGNKAIKRRAFKMFFQKSWGPRRSIPEFHSASFNKRWKDRKQGK